MCVCKITERSSKGSAVLFLCQTEMHLLDFWICSISFDIFIVGIIKGAFFQTKSLSKFKVENKNLIAL